MFYPKFQECSAKCPVEQNETGFSEKFLAGKKGSVLCITDHHFFRVLSLNLTFWHLIAQSNVCRLRYQACLIPWGQMGPSLPRADFRIFGILADLAWAIWTAAGEPKYVTIRALKVLWARLAVRRVRRSEIGGVFRWG